MLDQSVFTETIHEVAEIIRTSATPLSKEEILSYFKEMEASERLRRQLKEALDESAQMKADLSEAKREIFRLSSGKDKK